MDMNRNNQILAQKWSPKFSLEVLLKGKEDHHFVLILEVQHLVFLTTYSESSKGNDDDSTSKGNGI